MNKTGINWTEMTWNPIVGCLNPRDVCAVHDDCYARKTARRVGKMIGCKKCEQFIPHTHFERLDQPLKRKKPTTIFVGSMADMWGDFIPLQWYEKIFEVMRKAKQHRFLALTKNPARYLLLDLPPNLWCGVTVTGTTSSLNLAEVFMYSRIPPDQKRFVSFEPLLEDCADEMRPLIEEMCFDWLIVGPLNKSKRGPVTQRAWVDRIIELGKAAGVCVTLKPECKKLGYTDAELAKYSKKPWTKEG